jgi:hypothetical protein
VFTGNGSGLSAIAGANITGSVSSATTATTADTVTTNAQPNITSVGTLASLTVTGNAAAGNLTTGGVVTATGNVSGGNLTTPGVLTVTGTGVSSIAGNLDMTGNTISNLATPLASTDAATKQYVDDVAQGLHTHDSCNAATQTTLAIISGGTVTYNNGTSGVGATLTTTGSYITIDGVTLSNGMRILVKNEANTAHNGIYDRTSTTVLTRSDDFDTPTEMAGGDFTFVNAGTQYDNTGWVMTDPVTTVGTSPVVWIQFSGAGTYTAGTGLTLTGSQFSVNASQTQVTSVGTLTGLTVGNATANSIFGNGTINSTGNITAPFFFGNVVGNISGNFAVTGSNGEVIFNKEGNAGTSNGFTFNNTSNALSVNGTITAPAFTANTGVFTGNGSALTALNASNISTGTVAQARLANSNVILGSTTLALGTTTTTIDGLSSVTSTTFVGALTGAATSAGTVTTNAQPNITSVGTLANLNVSGNASFTGPNVSLGSNANVKITGGSTGHVLSTDGSGNLSWVPTGTATTAGTVTTNAQPNITSVGTLTGLGVNGNITAANITANTGVFTGNGSGLSAIAGANVTGTVASATSAVSATTAGTVTTAAQPNITSVGRLTGLTVGNATANSIFGNGTINSTGNITALNFIGNLVGNISGNIVVPGANGEVLFNNAGNAGTSNAFSFNSTSNALSVNGTVTAVNITANTGVFAGSGANLTTLNASNISSGTLAQARLANSNVILGSTTLALGTTTTTIDGLSSVTSTTFVGSLTGAATTAGTVTTAAQPNITSVGTLANLNVSGNVNFTGPNVSLGSNANVKITGGSTGHVLSTDGSGNLSWVPTGTATTAGTVTTNAQPNITSVGTLTSLGVSGTVTSSAFTANTGVFTGNGSGLSAIAGANVTGTVASATTAGTVTTAAQPNITSVGTLTSLGITGNITSGNANLGNAATANFFIGNGSQLTGVVAAAGSSIVNGTSNVVVAASGNVRTSVAGTPNVFTVTATGANIAGTLGATGNISIGSSYFIGDGSQLTNLPITQFLANGTSNIVVTNNGPVNISVDGSSNIVAFNKAITTITGRLDVTGNANVGNIGAASGVFTSVTGTLTTNAQPNITSVGTLTSLNSSGTVTAPAFTANTGVFTGNGSGLSAIAGANVSGAVAFATTANSVAGGNVSGAVAFATTANAVAGANVSGAVSSATTAGTVTTAAQPNITSVGTLTSLTVSGNISTANVTASGYHIRSVNTGISAAGSTQGTATAITKEINIVSTVAAGAGVVFPTAVEGMVITITNTSANALLVYPATSAAINSAALNAAYSQPAGSTLQFIAPTTTQWYTVGATFA